MALTKKWYTSKTVWIAFATGVAGVLAAILSEDPLIKGAGIIAMIKSVIDFGLRFMTERKLA